MLRVKPLVVSLHDVTPQTWMRVELLLDRLTAIGVSRCSLLVIPNWRGQSPIDSDEDFCGWLRHRQRAGDEIVLHGYEHIAVGQPRNARERFRNCWFTQNEGEFLSLNYEQARDRIQRGRAVLDRAGLNPQGFVAPAWLINDAGLRAARDLGFQYTNSYLTFADLAQERSYFAPSLVFGPGRLNEDLGIAAQRYISPLLARSPVVRVTLHPPCVDHPTRLTRILSMVAEQLRAHQPTTYLQLLAALRSTPPIVVQRRHAS